MNTSCPGISIVTGTLNRCALLPKIVANTVDADDRIELVLVDGGSADNTIEYVRNLNHPRIRLIEVGKRSSYPHFMNLGVRAARFEHICQWNDDVFLTNPWSDVFAAVNESFLMYIFSWKEDGFPRFKDKGWVLVNSKKTDGSGEIVMNYGIYHKNVFRKIGLYNNAYEFYCADGDMAQRAWAFGIPILSLPSIKAVALKGVRKSRSYDLTKDWQTYQEHIVRYAGKELPDNLEYLEPYQNSEQ